jgi:hypothetical protein
MYETDNGLGPPAGPAYQLPHDGPLPGAFGGDADAAEFLVERGLGIVEPPAGRGAERDDGDALHAQVAQVGGGRQAGQQDLQAGGFERARQPRPDGRPVQRLMYQGWLVRRLGPDDGPGYGRAHQDQAGRPLRHCRTRWRGVREPDVHVECRQPAGHRLTRPANLLQVRRHLVKAQARVIAARRADNLIPARVAISMAVDHADRLCPEESGATIMPGDSMTDRHAAIVHREPNVPAKETNELQVANWLHNTDRLQARPKHACRVHSVIKEPYRYLHPGGPGRSTIGHVVPVEARSGE